MAQKKSTVSYLTKKVIVNRSLSWLANLTNNKISPAIPSLSANREGMNGPINYLAIGDSMAAGYNPNYGGVDLIGSFDSDKKKITGSSYPAYFANYLNQSSQLASFHNHATTGSQITDWLVFLGVNEVDQQTQKSLTKLVANLKLNAHHNNPYQTIINSLFQVSGDGSQQIIACPSLIKFIQQANLITISLGANDFINAFETWFQWSNSSLKNKLTLWEKIKTTSEQIINNYQLLIKQIQKINPKTTIVLLSYPMPLLRFNPVVNDYLQRFLKIPPIFTTTTDTTISQLWLNILNHKIIRKVAITSQVEYLDCYQPTFWQQNSCLLVTNPFDIHPTEFGYQIIAQQLLLKFNGNNCQLYLDLKRGKNELNLTPFSLKKGKGRSKPHNTTNNFSQHEPNWNHQFDDLELNWPFPHHDPAVGLKKILTNDKLVTWCLTNNWKNNDQNNFWTMVNSTKTTNAMTIFRWWKRLDLKKFVTNFQKHVNTDCQNSQNFNLLTTKQLILVFCQTIGFNQGWKWWKKLLTINQQNWPAIKQWILNPNTNNQISWLIGQLLIWNHQTLYPLLTTMIPEISHLNIKQFQQMVSKMIFSSHFNQIIKHLLGSLIDQHEKYQKISQLNLVVNQVLQTNYTMISNHLTQLKKTQGWQQFF